MRRTLVIVSLGLALPACGPVVDPPVGDGGSQGTAESGTAESGTADTGEPPPSDTSAASDGSSSGPSASTSGGPTDDSASGGEELLVPRESVITEVSCTEDGQTQLFFEANLMGGYANCLPPAEGVEGFFYLSYQGWDGQAGTVLVGPEEAASAAVGFDEVTGTLEIEVSEPFHPTFYTVDVAGSGVVLQGVIDTRLCASVTATCGQ